MKFPVTVREIETEDGYEWIAEFPDVKGCVGGGITAQEAVVEAYENLEVHLEFLVEQGLPIPRQIHSSNTSFSGKIALRVSKGLHSSLSKCACEEGISNNQFIVEAISEKIGKDKVIIGLQNAITRIEDNAKLKYNSETHFNIKSNNLKDGLGGIRYGTGYKN